MTTKRISKRQLLKIIDELERKPHDRVRILGDIGITALGTGLGWAAAGTAASLAGATASTGVAATVAGWLGLTVVAATPVGWVIGMSAAGGLLAYGTSRLIRGGSLSEGRQRELLQAYTDHLREVMAKERAGDITDGDRTRFVVSLRELITHGIISPEKAFTVIEHVESGHLDISQAIKLLQDILNTRKTRQLT